MRFDPAEFMRCDAAAFGKPIARFGLASHDGSSLTAADVHHAFERGVTSHQRPLAAEMARSGDLDALMVRYNAAHRGAERDVLPEAARMGIPVISFTATRWEALLRRTPSDPRGFAPPRAPAWYRFALQQPAVSVVLCAPHTRAELDEDLTVLETTGPLSPTEHARLAEHGDRVRAHASEFR